MLLFPRCGRRSSSWQRGLLCLVVAGLALPLVAQAEAPTPSALEQIQTLTQMKKARTPAQHKLDSNLLIEVLRQRRDPATARLQEFRTGIDLDARERVMVDIRAEVTDELLAAVNDLGGWVESAFPRWNTLRVQLPLAALEALAERAEVRGVRPADRMLVNGNITVTEGDVAHESDTARTTFSVNGSGVTACAISDSVDELANLQAAGELPPGVTVLPGQSGNPGSSEGTALLEIMHDMAPGAALAFATANGGQAQFAQNILDLAAAGCKVIAEDVFYFAEPVFQDGIIAQAVDQVAADGVFYFVAAGNSGRLNAGTSGVWEGQYSATALPAALPGAGLSAHDFGGGSASNEITEDALNDAPFFTLWWSDPLDSAGNDYDLYLLDDTLTNVLGASTNTQNGDDDPFEILASVGEDDTGNRLVVVKFSGDDRFLQLNTHRGRLEFATAGQIGGHIAAEGAFAVAAVNVATAGGGPFTGGAANPSEPFNSDGPRRIFFNPDGSPVVPAFGSGEPLLGGQTSIVRQKPDIAAADGVSTTTPGFETFFGSSASAPHAAAISALLNELFPTVTQDDLFPLFESTALDIEAPGFDRDSGFGIIPAPDLLDNAADIFADGFESGDAASWTDFVP
ncbi:MAG: S8 family serine peptidase [Acidobacteriota bacterium]